MRTMMPARLAVGGLGVLVGLYGAYLGLSRLTSMEKVSVGKWLVGGVIVHDGLIALSTLVVGAVVMRLVPVWARASVAAGLVVLATVTVVGIPVMTLKGRRTVNPSLLDRHYRESWLVLAVVVLVCVVAGALRARHAAAGHGAAQDADRGDDGAGARGRRRPDGA